MVNFVSQVNFALQMNFNKHELTIDSKKLTIYKKLNFAAEVNFKSEW